MISKFISENWKWLLTSLIAVGVAYSQFQEMRNDMDTVKRRQQNYIDLLKQERAHNHKLELRIMKLETIIEMQ